MKNTDCSVVADLLPLYLDGILSEVSKEFVEKHLETCKKCGKNLEQLKEDREYEETRQKEQEKRLISSLKRRKYEILGLIIGIIVAVGAILGTIVLAFRGTIGNVAVHSESTSEYGEQKYTGIGGGEIFPAKEQVKDSIQEYYFDAEGVTLYQNYQIYLKCQYTEAAFLEEKERLQNIKDAKTGKIALYTEEENDLPMVYTMLYDEGYEYALLDEAKREIIYIYLQGAIDRRELAFDEEYLPVDYGQNGLHFETEREPYRIYEKKE